VNYFKELESGRIDAVLTDTPIAKVNLVGNTKLALGGPPFATSYYAVGVRSGEPALLGLINQAIGDLIADGTLERIYTKYELWTPEQEGLKTWKEDITISSRNNSFWHNCKVFFPML